MEIDSNNIYTCLLYIANFISSRKVIDSKANNVPKLKGFGKVAWNFISSIYEFGWGSLSTDKYNNSSKTRVLNKFIPKSPKINLGSTLGEFKSKAAKIIKLLSLISIYPPRKVLEKSKFFGKEKDTMIKTKTNTRQSHT